MVVVERVSVTDGAGCEGEDRYRGLLALRREVRAAHYTVMMKRV